MVLFLSKKLRGTLGQLHSIASSKSPAPGNGFCWSVFYVPLFCSAVVMMPATYTLTEKIKVNPQVPTIYYHVSLNLRRFGCESSFKKLKDT